MTGKSCNPKKKKKRQKRKRIMHCSKCGEASPSYCKDFKSQMAWLRRHRKRKHPTAHKKSVKKTQKTKKKLGNPVPVVAILTALSISKEAWDRMPEKKKRAIFKQFEKAHRMVHP